MSKKSRKQRERKRAKIGVKVESSEVLLKKQKNNEARSESLQYLQTWSDSVTDKSISWKFQKSKQVWLLKNMLYLEKVPAKSFKQMISYVASMTGEAKERLFKELQGYLNKEDTIPFDDLEKQLIKEIGDSEERKELEEKIKVAKMKRIEKVLKK